MEQVFAVEQALDVEQVFAVEWALAVEQAQRSTASPPSPLLAFKKSTSAPDVEQVFAVEWALDVEQAQRSTAWMQKNYRGLKNEYVLNTSKNSFFELKNALKKYSIC